MINSRPPTSPTSPKLRASARLSNDKAVIPLDQAATAVRGAELALALVTASPAPTLLLDAQLTILAVSEAFLDGFRLAGQDVIGRSVSAVGQGEWQVPQLQARLQATAQGSATIDAYEMDLITSGRPTRRLVIKARKIDYGAAASVRILVTITDVTAARGVERLTASLLADKAVMMQELQHRVANSLQIIASIILQSARQVESPEDRRHLHAAHSRVMSVAGLQRFLATAAKDEAPLAAYFVELSEILSASVVEDCQHIVIKVDVDDSRVSPEAAMSLGLLTTELVINALKHAFPEARAGQITIGYHSDASGWTLQVEDNGVGMPLTLDQPKPGLGTGIVRALAGQLGGQVLVSDARPGVRVQIRHDAQAQQPTGVAV